MPETDAPSAVTRRRLLTLAAGAVAAMPVMAGVGRAFAQAPIRWIDVHTHPIGGRNADYVGAIEAAAGIMDESNIAMMLLMPPPQVAGAEAEHMPGAGKTSSVAAMTIMSTRPRVRGNARRLYRL